jgi:ribosome-binding factor A
MEGYTVKQNKVSKLIQTVMADIFQKKGFNAYGGAMISVPQVRISPDLAYAKIFISIFATKTPKEEVLEMVKADTKNLRFELGKRIRNQVRIIPEITFFIDDSLDHIEKIDSLLK